MKIPSVANIQSNLDMLSELRTQRIETQWLTARLLSHIKLMSKWGQKGMDHAALQAGMSVCQARKYALSWECLRSQLNEEHKKKMIPLGPNKVYNKYVRGRAVMITGKGRKVIQMDGKDFQREAQRDDENHRYNLV